MANYSNDGGKNWHLSGITPNMKIYLFSVVYGEGVWVGVA